MNANEIHKRVCAPEREVAEARAEIEHARHDIERAEQELHEAEAHLLKAEEEERRHESREVEIKVDNRPVRIARGVYLVSAFKALVGVVADRELDVFKDGTFVPLADGGEIRVVECEVFVSHVRTGGSS